MKHPDETLYMYASARLHALERHMIGRERLEALLAARTPADIMARLRDYGVLAPAATGSADHPADVTGKATSDTLPTPTEREAALTALLRTAYRETEEALPDPALVRYLRYPYDATNLKIAMKCLVRGISPAGM
ncbi:MAG: V-type ATPase subunit, partial [Clostridia bacterium]|nr:V-type ATPase subunit [Clostridia bacterium]